MIWVVGEKVEGLMVGCSVRFCTLGSVSILCAREGERGAHLVRGYGTGVRAGVRSGCEDKSAGWVGLCVGSLLVRSWLFARVVGRVI